MPGLPRATAGDVGADAVGGGKECRGMAVVIVGVYLGDVGNVEEEEEEYPEGVEENVVVEVEAGPPRGPWEPFVPKVSRHVR